MTALTAAEFTALDAVTNLHKVAYFQNAGDGVNGTLVAYADAPGGALDAATDALAALRAGTLKPPAATKLTFLEFMALFSETERDAIVSSTDTTVRLFCLMAAGAAYVELTDPQTIGGVHYLESVNLIAKGRVAQVLAASLPPAA